MKPNKIVSKEEWLEARKEFLSKEKEFTRLREQLSQERRNLPWVEVEKEYSFLGPNGQEKLTDLFDGRSQLVIYHFMFGPDWEEGCPSCSFWADNFNGIIVHLNQRDVTMLAVSRAPLEKLEAYKARLGWSFKWVSSLDSDFNFDFQASYSSEQSETDQVYYNFEYREAGEADSEHPGISVFYKDDQGKIYHTYSTYARGLDMTNNAYHYLDLVPKGRDEAGLPWAQAWVRRNDSYEE